MTGPQVALRYLMELGVIVIPKSSKKERMAQNLDLFDFELSAEDKAELAKLDTGNPEARYRNPNVSLNDIIKSNRQ